MKVYLAGPLFSVMERDYLVDIRSRLESFGYTVEWPFTIFTESDIIAWGEDAPVNIMATNSSVLEICDVVVAILDGPQVNDGVAWEIGYARAKNIPVVGLRTDFRNRKDSDSLRINSMIHGSCYSVSDTLFGVLQSLRKIENERRGM